jgi:hypothetical protein
LGDRTRRGLLERLLKQKGGERPYKRRERGRENAREGGAGKETGRKRQGTKEAVGAKAR